MSNDLQEGCVQLFHLGADIAQLNDTKPSTKGFVSKVLLKTLDLRLVLFAMQAGSQIAKHRSEGRIAVHCLRGSIRLQLPSQARELREDKVLVLDPEIQHDVQAIEDSVFLLTMVLPR